MAFCANCGAAVADNAGFCAACGKPANNPAANAGPTSAATPAAPAVSAAPGLTSNMAGALAYLFGFITGIVFLVLEPYKNDRFVRFHAMQSIFFSAAWIIFNIAWGIFWGMAFAVSSSMWALLFPLRMLIHLALFLYWIYLMYQAYSNREYRIPFIGDLAAKQVG